MDAVNMHEAKTKLSKLVEAVENGAEAEVIISRNGKPVAKLVPIAPVVDVSRRLGIANGKYRDMSLEDFNSTDAEIAAMFYGDND